jgi:polyisoprenoid-binding protein YceI
MSRNRQLWIALSLLLAAAAARADEFAEDHAPESGQVQVTWHASMGESQASGTSRSLEWSRRAFANGDSEVRFRIPVASFSSGVAERDAKARAAVEATKYPFVELEGLVHGSHFEGTVTLHGVTRRLAMELALTQQGQTLTTRATFTLDVRDFGVTPHEISPQVTFELFARLPADPQVVVSGGAVFASL